MIAIQKGVWGKYEVGRLKETLAARHYSYVYDHLPRLLNHTYPIPTYFYGSLEGNEIFKSVFNFGIYDHCHPHYYTIERMAAMLKREEMLNVDPVYITVDESLYDEVASGKRPPFFMRTPLGDKSVSGTVVEPEEIEFLRNRYIGKCVATFPVQGLKQEVRVVVRNNTPHTHELVTASQYIDENEHIVLNPVEWTDLKTFESFTLPSLHYMGRKRLDEWYTVDFGWVEKEGRWKIVEINSMWCAGLYGCDWQKIIDKL